MAGFTIQSVRRFGPALTAVAITVAGVLASRAAQAGVGIAADLEAGIPLESEADAAVGIAGRLGYTLQLPAFFLTPEIGVHYTSFDSNPSMWRGLAGVRIGFGEIFRFGAYAHGGVGSLSFDSADGVTGFAFDAGGFFDFALLRALEIGVHAGYGFVDVADYAALRWAPLGMHVEWVF